MLGPCYCSPWLYTLHACTWKDVPEQSHTSIYKLPQMGYHLLLAKVVLTEISYMHFKLNRDFGRTL